MSSDLIKKIDPWAFTALTAESADKMPKENWLSTVNLLLFSRNDLLTEHWVTSINEWAKAFKVGSLLSNNLPTDVLISKIGPLKIIKTRITPSLYYTRCKFVAVDDSGWKFWFGLQKNYTYNKDNFKWPKVNSIITIEDFYIRESKTGISFIENLKTIKKDNKIIYENNLFVIYEKMRLP